ncbi:DHA1 family bicyclomycin/chloramphenicol resistance-like MFS transporter [Algoriphagus ratkowskyi]|uniref:DHA1 family bicyclomycin/chloramphenicol resistance-like MFS transporter n=1 Tax=Algoriphagus ratkowskyi TaxID=57028 RepID=A0A2W7QY34_9BACT|nr:multidrug effflux MFS transporter [Algoriphagus ratkowskyi]PZX53428.1 DHA1 family bicyclomycin/chloramphenicol resistance-like MFS transporter [Algoriphagus ratkowskyi]
MEKKYSKKEYFKIILVLGALCTISPFSIDMYLPGFPEMAVALNTPISNIQLSLTAYLVGIAIGQLFYGPLLDKYGRKKPLYVGLAIYILASIGCAMSQSVENLIFMRFLQAVGGCAGMVSAQAIVRDIFPVKKIAQAMSLLVLVIAVSPMIAPTLGGFVTSAYDWHWVFIILAALTALIWIAAVVVLPSGAVPDGEVSLKPKQVWKGYLKVLENRQFLVYMLVGGIAGSAPFVYIASSADVFMNLYGFTEHQFGWLFAILAFAMIGSTQLNHILLKKYSSHQIIYFSLHYQSFTGLLLVIGIFFNLLNVTGLIGLMFVFLTAHGLNSPNTTALAMTPFSKNAGSASAMLGSMRMAFGGIVTAIVSLLHASSAFPMVMGMAICALGGFVVLKMDQYIPGTISRKQNSKSFAS